MNAKVLFCFPILVQATALKLGVETAAWQLIKQKEKWMILKNRIKIGEAQVPDKFCLRVKTLDPLCFYKFGSRS